MIDGAPERAAENVLHELSLAVANFPPIHSPHEGYAVIKEELDELWKAVKADHGREREAYIEARQVAAMAIRYMCDLFEV